LAIEFDENGDRTRGELLISDVVVDFSFDVSNFVPHDLGR
jgi:hypothetical protein